MFQTGPETADVLAFSHDREALVEVRVAYPLTWHPDRTFGPDDEPGCFISDRMVIHRVGGIPRYIYELRGEHWARVPAPRPPDYGTP